ncbi:MAG: ribonuclease III [Flavobacteriales bacterium]|nr:ribonuclease III [Flavobacteriales bacterium]
MTLLKKVFRKKNELALVLERMLGFYPKQLSLYQQAFLHKSVIKENELKPFESNERLEFLGDAILDSVISHYLFARFPFKDEGYLTQLRSRLVSRQNLNQLAVKLGMPELIQSRLDKESNSIYGDALEALIGAIYLDKGYDVARQFIETRLLHHHIDMEEVVKTETDFKSRVIEWCQKEKQEFEFLFIEEEDGADKIYKTTFLVNGEIKGKGAAKSKKKAEQQAAEEFYKTIS